MEKQNETANEKSSIWREIWEYVRIVLVVVIGVTFLTQVLVINAVIPSGSMEKTILKGDRIIGNRLAYLKEKPERFDIVIFKYPDDESKIFIKRVIGLPGETVEIRDGKVYINGADEPLNDSFCPEEPTGDYGPYRVPQDSYFMLGDNREHSLDSRLWVDPYVDEEAILGKAAFRYWPLNRISGLK